MNLRLLNVTRLFLRGFRPSLMACIGLALLCSACGGRPETGNGRTTEGQPSPPSTDAATKRSPASVANNKHDPTLRSAGWAWVEQGPHASTLADARRIDEARKLFDDGLYDQAQKAVAALLADHSTHPLAYQLQAQLCAQRGELDQATTWCDQAIASSPWWIEPRLLLAQCYIKLKRLAAAETVFGDIDRLAPHSPWGAYGQGALALMRGDRERAVQLLDEALRRDDRHLPSLKARIDLAGWLRQTALEEQLLGRFLHEEPNAPWVHGRLGELAMAAQRLDDARRTFTHAYELQPDRSIAQRLAEIAQRRNDAAEAAYWQARAGTQADPKANP
jgi:tetratricopeptide (TPR) repeat protein